MARLALSERLAIQIAISLNAGDVSDAVASEQINRAKALGLTGAEIEAARQGRSFDVRDDAAVALARAVLAGHAEAIAGARCRAALAGLDKAAIRATEDLVKEHLAHRKDAETAGSRVACGDPSQRLDRSTSMSKIKHRPSTSAVTHHRTAEVDGLSLFYREAGPTDAPAVLLLHGFPTSSHMFRNLIPALSDRYHVIAPDYPGYGQSDMPDRSQFEYTFDRFAGLVDRLLHQLGISRYAMYVMDYGAPVGWRLALRHPGHVSALIVQNGNAYEEGLKEFWDPIKAYWKEPTEQNAQPLRALFTLEMTKFQYTDGVRDLSRIAPDNWVHDQALLDRPGNAEIQLAVMYDYRTNVPMYPSVQQYFRDMQPPTLIVWGEHDYIFPADGAHPYKRDLTDLEFHLIDTGHFALEDKSDEIVPLIRDFLQRKVDGH